MSKWEKVAELCEAIVEDDTLFSEDMPKNLQCLCYAPNIGYRAWIFRYKGLLISLWDMGNCHWSFNSVVTWWDYLIARFGRRFRKC